MIKLEGMGLTRADQHCVGLDLKMTVGIAKNMPVVERRAFLTRWNCTGPHKSGTVKLSPDAVNWILAKL